MNPKSIAVFINDEYKKHRGTFRMFTGGAPEISTATKYLADCSDNGIENIFIDYKAFLGLVVILYTAFCRHLGGGYAEEYGGIGSTKRLFVSDPLLNGETEFRGNGQKLFFASGIYNSKNSQLNSDLTLREAAERDNSATVQTLVALLSKENNTLGNQLLEMKFSDVTLIIAEFIPERFLSRSDRASYLKETFLVKDTWNWIQNSSNPANSILFLSNFIKVQCQTTNNPYPLEAQHTLGNTSPALDVKPFFLTFLTDNAEKLNEFFLEATNDQVKELAVNLAEQANSRTGKGFGLTIDSNDSVSTKQAKLAEIDLDTVIRAIIQARTSTL